MKHILQQHLLQTDKDSRRAGIYSVCSAHSWVLQAAAEQSREDDSLLLIEATSNQVNQNGGYTGMKPADFRRFAEHIVDAAGFDRKHLILGGDHLGPNPWRTLAPGRGHGECRRNGQGVCKRRILKDSSGCKHAVRW